MRDPVFGSVNDPMEIWSTQATVLTESIIKAGLKPADIVSIGITNQRETTTFATTPVPNKIKSIVPMSSAVNGDIKYV